jgi:hypothetical protein
MDFTTISAYGRQIWLENRSLGQITDPSSDGDRINTEPFKWARLDPDIGIRSESTVILAFRRLYQQLNIGHESVSEAESQRWSELASRVINKTIGGITTALSRGHSLDHEMISQNRKSKFYRKGQSVGVYAAIDKTVFLESKHEMNGVIKIENNRESWSDHSFLSLTLIPLVKIIVQRSFLAIIVQAVVRLLRNRKRRATIFVWILISSVQKNWTLSLVYNIKSIGANNASFHIAECFTPRDSQHLCSLRQIPQIRNIDYDAEFTA